MGVIACRRVAHPAVFNIQHVMEHNAAQRSLLPGNDVLLALTTRFRPTPQQQGMQQQVPDRVATLEQSAAESVMRRMHQDIQEDDQTAAFWRMTAQGLVVVTLKVGMPVFLAERGVGRKWAHTHTWLPDAAGASMEILSGQLGVIVAIVDDPSTPNAAAHLPYLTCSSKAVLVRLDSSSGPVVQVPVVTRGVLVAGPTGTVFEVDVDYLPIRAGWATTVSATQGLEFARVLLDLNRAGWLAGGGYSGVGRVRGDLRTGLRILGGFSGSRDVFASVQDVIDWYRQRVLPSMS